ncbi:MAG: hypothetical protein WCS94_22960 [Verrucomicrobiota bacterium]
MIHSDSDFARKVNLPGFEVSRGMLSSAANKSILDWQLSVVFGRRYMQAADALK